MSGSNTFGGTIKLEGEKAYRQAISGINSDLKVLASEMSKVTAEFGKNNLSTSSLASKSKVLNEQIERQKAMKSLKNAEKLGCSQKIFYVCKRKLIKTKDCTGVFGQFCVDYVVCRNAHFGVEK